MGSCEVMTLRAVDGSYAPGGRFFSDPDLPQDNHLFDFGVPSLDLVNGLALGYLSHYNGCKSSRLRILEKGYLLTSFDIQYVNVFVVVMIILTISVNVSSCFDVSICTI